MCICHPLHGRPFAIERLSCFADCCLALLPPATLPERDQFGELAQDLHVDPLRVIVQQLAAALRNAVSSSSYTCDRPGVLKMGVRPCDAVVVETARPARKELGSLVGGHMES